MVMITTEVQVDVDLEDVTSDELIAEIESRDNWIVIDKLDSDFIAPRFQDEIYKLYRDYINDNGFDQKLKQFFEDQLGILVA